MAKIEIEVKLSDEDRSLLRGVQAAAKAVGAKAAGSKPAAGKKPAAEAEDDGFDNVDGDADVDGEDGEEAGEEDDGLGEDDGSAEDEGPTRDDVQAALRAYATKTNNKAKAIALMKKHGGSDALSKLKPAKFAAVIAAAKAATKAAK